MQNSHNPRETLQEAKLTLVKEYPDEIIVKNEDGIFELWGLNDGYAGYALSYKGHEYEFCRSAKSIRQLGD